MFGSENLIAYSSLLKMPPTGTPASPSYVLRVGCEPPVPSGRSSSRSPLSARPLAAGTSTGGVQRRPRRIDDRAAVGDGKGDDGVAAAVGVVIELAGGGVEHVHEGAAADGEQQHPGDREALARQEAAYLFAIGGVSQRCRRAAADWATAFDSYPTRRQNERNRPRLRRGQRTPGGNHSWLPASRSRSTARDWCRRKVG